MASAIAMPRFTLKNMHVTIDRKTYSIANMNILDVLIAGAPEWIAPKQRLEFSFVITLPDWERSLPTFGVVMKNSSAGLEVRYNPPNSSWRTILMKLLTEENKAK
jgi:hypothetical protein